MKRKILLTKWKIASPGRKETSSDKWLVKRAKPDKPSQEEKRKAKRTAERGSKRARRQEEDKALLAWPIYERKRRRTGRGDPGPRPFPRVS